VTRRRARGWAAELATIAVLMIAIVQVGLMLLRPEAGILGVVQILSPHLALAGLVLAPLALVRGSWRLRVALLVLVALSLVRFGGDWLSIPMPRSGDGEPVTIATWNLEVGARSTGQTVAVLHELDADIVLLQELTPDVTRAIETDATLVERYPDQALDPIGSGSGQGVLSRFPLRDVGSSINPILQTMIVEAGEREVRLVNAHPVRGELRRLILGVPTVFDPDDRREDLEGIRSVVEGSLAAGETLILAGDFNTTPPEPAYGRLTEGLRDVHAEIGFGTGWTWRPSRLEGLGIGLIRLDMVLVGPGVEPLGIDVACVSPGDHCPVTARVSLLSP
jgi:endonuclease/exonuclease/phosphatase family metal-dependent hydrolase